ncbi:MAG: zf-HC2 domain-containing protein [Saprospiraceae bacterium]|nr:zf-HC2 domain-containing protein [Saprospiraceae bacterium]
MSNCKEIELQIVDYIDGTLNGAGIEVVEQHLISCESCKKMEIEYRLLFTAMNDDQAELPSENLDDAFEVALMQETRNLRATRTTKPTKTVQIPLHYIYKVAAVFVLMVGSYWFGNYTTQREFMPELVDLTVQKQELKTIAALSLFENESASKRIQAVEFAQELENPADEILIALINEMLQDKLVNVRLASARALERFSEYGMVKDAYIQALKTEENPSMQIELIEILAFINEKRAIPKMKELLKDDATPIFIKDKLESELQNLI